MKTPVLYKPVFTNQTDNGEENYASGYVSGERLEHRAEVRNAGSLGVRLVHLQGSTNANIDPANPEILLGMTLKGRARARWSWGEEWYEIAQRTRGDFGLTPLDSEGRFEVTGDHQVLVLCLPIRFIKSTYDDEDTKNSIIPTDFGELHTKYRKDNLVSHLCQELWELSHDASPQGIFSADSATIYLLSRLQRLANISSEKRDSDLLSIPLEKRELERLKSFIVEHLDQKITNPELSRLFDMPVRRFQDRIKATTGESPRQFVLRIRVECAVDKIQKGQDLAEVAQSCGFADQSHLCKAVQQIMGRSPSEFRKPVVHWDFSRTS